VVLLLGYIFNLINNSLLILVRLDLSHRVSHLGGLSLPVLLRHPDLLVLVDLAQLERHVVITLLEVIQVVGSQKVIIVAVNRHLLIFKEGLEAIRLFKRDGFLRWSTFYVLDVLAGLDSGGKFVLLLIYLVLSKRVKTKNYYCF
jgi:hypothetical protein